MNPLNHYPPGRIPFEVLDSSVNHPFEDLVDHVVEHHRKRGRQVSRESVKRGLHVSADKMGLSRSEGEGLFGDVWRHIKQAGSNLVGNAFKKFSDDPLGTLEAIGSVIAPLLTKAV